MQYEPKPHVQNKKRHIDVVVPVPANKRLRASMVKPKTLGLYSYAVEEFEAWCGSKLQTRVDHDKLDKLLTAFIHELCEDARPITDASYTIFGWILLRSQLHMPERDQLPFAKQALKGWKSRFPGHSRSGVDLTIWDLVALQCLRMGFIYSAAAILIQGDAYLRPCEILGMRRECVIVPRALQSGCTWGVVISPQEEGIPTKAGSFDDCILFDSQGRSDVNLIVKALYLRSKGQEMLFHRLSYRAYCNQLTAASEQLGLTHLHLSPHVLRHSGASHDAFHKLRDLQSIQSRGRWKAARSVERYRKPGRMLLCQNRVSQMAWTKAKKARQEVVTSLTSALSHSG